MFKLLTNGRQPHTNNLPAVRHGPPPPAVNDDRTKFVGPAKHAVTVMCPVQASAGGGRCAGAHYSFVAGSGSFGLPAFSMKSLRS